MLAQRRKLLQYLRRADFDAYAKMLSALGLKDRYMKQVIPTLFVSPSWAYVGLSGGSVPQADLGRTMPSHKCRYLDLCIPPAKLRLTLSVLVPHSPFIN